MAHRRALVASRTTASEAIPSAETAISFGDRLVYPYSVIPGGIDSVEELKKAIDRDPVVAAHYKDFDVAHARVERLETPTFAHVSYRMADRVYWTRRPLLLPAGERVVTDGSHIARVRCGNQLESTPGPVSPAEPAPAVLDTPVAPTPPLRATALPPSQHVPGATGTAPGPFSGGVAPLGGAGALAAGGTLPAVPVTPDAKPEGPGGPADPDARAPRPPEHGSVPVVPPVGIPPIFTPPDLPGNPGSPPGGPIPPLVPGLRPNPPGGGDPGTNGPGAPTPLTPISVPEPGSMVLFVAGLGALAVRRLLSR